MVSIGGKAPHWIPPEVHMEKEHGSILAYPNGSHPVTQKKNRAKNCFSLWITTEGSLLERTRVSYKDLSPF